MSILLFIGLSLYVIFLLVLFIGWSRISSQEVSFIEPNYKYSIVVAFRNESENLWALIESIKGLDFPKSAYELILVNDHSTDNFQDTLSALDLGDLVVKQYNLSDAHGKKKALAMGIAMAVGDVILTTDADCELPANWLKIYAYYFERLQAAFVFGGVSLRGNNTMFSRLQQIEFSSLIGSGAATLALGFPSMCNGANLGYKKEVFDEVGGFEDNKDIPSGDDEFLMHKIYKKYPDNVFFIKNTQSVVTTGVNQSWKAFFNQRKRWASKWKWYKSWSNSMLAVLVLLFHVCVIASYAYLIFNALYFSLLTLLFIKVIMEGIFLQHICKTLGNKFYILPFLILQIVYPFYVVVFGLSANFGNYQWKGRKHRL